jgi:hypothetical protein
MKTHPPQGIRPYRNRQQGLPSQAEIQRVTRLGVERWENTAQAAVVVVIVSRLFTSSGSRSKGATRLVFDALRFELKLLLVATGRLVHLRDVLFWNLVGHDPLQRVERLGMMFAHERADVSAVERLAKPPKGFRTL